MERQSYSLIGEFDALHEFCKNYKRIYLYGAGRIGKAYLEEENTPSFVDKVIQIEIDGDLFFNEVSMDVTSWSFDLYDLEQNKPVYEYIKENHAEELKALEDGKAKYIEVYRDVF